MRYAKTVKQVTFNEAIALMKGVPRSNLVMGYRYINNWSEEISRRSTKVSATEAVTAGRKHRDA